MEYMLIGKLTITKVGFIHFHFVTYFLVFILGPYLKYNNMPFAFSYE